jgi:hypothetical protein
LAAFLAPLRKTDRVVYAKKPFGGPQAMLAYCRAIPTVSPFSNRRLIAADETGVALQGKDYRMEGPDRYKTMTLPTHEFIRRFGKHVLPKGLHERRSGARGRYLAFSLIRTSVLGLADMYSGRDDLSLRFFTAGRMVWRQVATWMPGSAAARPIPS